MRKVVITKDISGQRLDKFLMRHLNNAPKPFVHKMIRKKNIVVNGTKAEASYIVNEGDIVTMFLSENTIDRFTKEKTVPVHAGKLDIIYEDENIAVVNKPAGLLTQPDSLTGDSLVGRLRYHLKDNAFSPVVVNRLDRNTTGAVLCAKNLHSAQILSKLMHDREIKKHYLAVAHGNISKSMELIGFHSKDSTKNIAIIENTQDNVPRGTLNKRVFTRVAPLEYNKDKDVSLIRVGLETGRSHQIRAHLASAGHPLVGDIKYGGEKGYRQLLHAYEIGFSRVPGILDYLSGKKFFAPLPDDIGEYFDDHTKINP